MTGSCGEVKVIGRRVAGSHCPNWCSSPTESSPRKRRPSGRRWSTFGSAPQPGSPWTQDDEAVADRADPVAQGRATVLRYARHQASLIYVNAWDHLITLARVLGGDGAMPLFSQASLARVVCEAAVRFAWLMDPDISSAKRLVRAAVALHFSAEERSKGVRALPAERFDPRIYRRCLTAAARSGTPSAT